MANKRCSLEEEVLDCLRSGKAKPAILSHISACAICRESAAVFKWMKRFHDIAWKIEIDKKNLPSAGAVWRMNQENRRPPEDLVQRALQPLRLSRAVFYGVTLISAVLILIFKFRDIGRFARNLLGSDIAHNTLSALNSLIALVFIIPAIIVILSFSVCLLIDARDNRKKQQIMS